ncbi:hypothetical protein HZ326_27454 [Fusarium oxysporum f. sp. albedinis]|nr:hypothetical protein HZ326_27454 [Fusarium oxysporum f. sp. albedinis]
MTTTTYTTTYTTSGPVTFPSPPPQQEVPSYRYDEPEAIYARYKASREAWRATLPPRALRDDKAYRKAKCLKAKYTKAAVKYALGFKQMGPQYVGGIGERRRAWTEEEINAYLDFEEAEDQRVQRDLERQFEAAPYLGRNGVQDSRDQGMRDGQARQEYFDNWKASNQNQSG